ncbi:MAG: GNAT family N-acetyltransferase [Verrucomicrobia bacterium]|nr:GNAT family N-acetyltransferase [Verrucomicrobiota bacterium]
MVEFVLEPLQKTAQHEELLYAWRSDPETALMSFHQKHMQRSTFGDYFEKYFLLKDLPSLFAHLDGKRVAFIGFDPFSTLARPNRQAAEVSIIVDPQKRNQGIGTELLRAALHYASQQGYDDLYARIKTHNCASVHIFEKAGFSCVEETAYRLEEECLDIPIKVFRAELTPYKPIQKTLIIAEAGSNWRMGSYERDLKMAKALINVAKEAGCDVVKFQTYRAETIYAPNAGKSNYLSKAGIVEEMSSLFEELAMPYEMVSELSKMCAQVGIEFMSTPFSPQDFAAVDPFVSRHKIASYEISHVRLLELAAKSKKPLLLSTGASTVADIQWAVSFLKKCGGVDLTLLHCCAQYPSTPKAMNLRAIEWMHRVFQRPIGLSDHSRDPIVAPLGAVALGATVIEKHFTLDRRLPGPDHAFAIEPEELSQMVRAIREMEAMAGSGYKAVQEEEMELYHFAKRRLHAIAPINKGDHFVEGVNIAILRSGNQKPGVHPRHLDDILSDKVACRAISLGEGIQYGDWK